MNVAMTYWGKCLEILKDNLSASAYRTWFAPIVPLQFEKKILVLQVSSQFIVEYIEENYIDLLKKTIFRVCGEGTRLEYRVLIDSRSGAGSTIPSQGVVVSETHPNMIDSHDTQETAQFQQSAIRPSDLDSQLNTRYTFHSFVDGDSNRLARTAGLTISGNPGKTAFNPLFIYGGSGVGKTHLVNAIGNEIKQLYPDKRVLYVTANTFRVQYVDAVRNNNLNDFIHFYQTIDVLIVDDIQYLAGQAKTQDAFFFIFNHLHQIGKQLILTSDRSPKDLEGIHDRLITRFKWGLTAEIRKPDFLLRRAILQAAIHRDGLEIADDIVDYIAENVRDNVRDLEGVLASLLAHSMLINTPIDQTLAEDVVARVVVVRNNEVTLDAIVNTVCEHYHVPEKLFYSRSRRQEVAQARHVAMYIAKKMTDKPLQEIGLHMGNRNHATVVHALKVVGDQLGYNHVFKHDVDLIENALVK